MTSPNGPGGRTRRPDASITRFGDSVLAPTPEQVAAAARQNARLRAAIDAGWVIRIDPVRMEYVASRETLTARSADALLDMIDAQGES